MQVHVCTYPPSAFEFNAIATHYTYRTSFEPRYNPLLTVKHLHLSGVVPGSGSVQASEVVQSYPVPGPSQPLDTVHLARAK